MRHFFSSLEAFHCPRFTSQSNLPPNRARQKRSMDGQKLLRGRLRRAIFSEDGRDIPEKPRSMTVLYPSCYILTDHHTLHGLPRSFSLANLSLSFFWPHVGLIVLFNLIILSFSSCRAFSQDIFLQSCFSMPASQSPCLVSWHQSQRMASTTGHIVPSTRTATISAS